MGGVAWTEEEDHLLKKCIEQYGEGKWHRVPVLAGLNRCRKSCRLRWLNYLRPNIRRGTFTDEEVLVIIKLHNHLGNRWSLIASRLPGRTANDVKNYWNCHLSKKLDKLHLIENNPTSFIAANNQVNFTAHHNIQAVEYGISTTSSAEPQEDKASLGYGRGENEFAAKFEETRMKGGGEMSSMDNIWDWDDLIYDMDLWG